MPQESTKIYESVTSEITQDVYEEYEQIKKIYEVQFNNTNSLFIYVDTVFINIGGLMWREQPEL